MREKSLTHTSLIQSQQLFTLAIITLAHSRWEQGQYLYSLIMLFIELGSSEIGVGYNIVSQNLKYSCSLYLRHISHSLVAQYNPITRHWLQYLHSPHPPKKRSGYYSKAATSPGTLYIYPKIRHKTYDFLWYPLKFMNFKRHNSLLSTLSFPHTHTPLRPKDCCDGMTGFLKWQQHHQMVPTKPPPTHTHTKQRFRSRTKLHILSWHNELMTSEKDDLMLSG